jgi:hypothetical protein
VNNDFATSVIRTVTPMVAGWLLATLASWGIQLDDQAAASLGAFLAALFAAVYYVLVRLWEKKSPKAGMLLGSATKPKYGTPK